MKVFQELIRDRPNMDQPSYKEIRDALDHIYAETLNDTSDEKEKSLQLLRMAAKDEGSWDLVSIILRSVDILDNL